MLKDLNVQDVAQTDNYVILKMTELIKYHKKCTVSAWNNTHLNLHRMSMAK